MIKLLLIFVVLSGVSFGQVKSKVTPRKQIEKKLTEIIALCEKKEMDEMALILRVARTAFKKKDETNLLDYTSAYAIWRIKKDYEKYYKEKEDKDEGTTVETDQSGSGR